MYENLRQRARYPIAFRLEKRAPDDRLDARHVQHIVVPRALERGDWVVGPHRGLHLWEDWIRVSTVHEER